MTRLCVDWPQRAVYSHHNTNTHIQTFIYVFISYTRSKLRAKRAVGASSSMVLCELVCVGTRSAHTLTHTWSWEQGNKGCGAEGDRTPGTYAGQQNDKTCVIRCRMHETRKTTGSVGETGRGAGEAQKQVYHNRAGVGFDGA